jgi:hypothetical protein
MISRIGLALWFLLSRKLLLKVSPPPTARFRAGWVYASMGTVGVALLEKEKNYAQAVDTLRLLLGGLCCPGASAPHCTRMRSC